MIFTSFDCLSAQRQKNKKPKAHRNWFLLNYGRLVNLEGARLGPSLSNKVNFFLKGLPDQISCPNVLQFK